MVVVEHFQHLVEAFLIVLIDNIFGNVVPSVGLILVIKDGSVALLFVFDSLQGSHAHFDLFALLVDDLE